MICAPLGQGLLCLPTTRFAATPSRSRREGFCVVRFDYDGTGDSVGRTTDPGPGRRLAREHRRCAIRMLRDAGVGWVALVGDAFGRLAGLARRQRRTGPIEALVLIDPVPSGRSFVSEQRAIAAMAIGVKAEARGRICRDPRSRLRRGRRWKTFKKLRIGSDESVPAAKRVWCSPAAERRRQRSRRPRLRSDVGRMGGGDRAGGPRRRRGAAPAAPPTTTSSESPNGSRRLPRPTTVAVKVPRRAGAVAVAEGPDGRQVVERPGFLGPTGLFGIVTEVPGRVLGPAIVFLNVATEPHVGPARLWVQLARRWAALGLRCVRVDMSGLGDSPARPGEPEFVIRLPVNFDDVAGDRRRRCHLTTRLTLSWSGLCSSAYQALDSADGTAPARSDRPQPGAHLPAARDARGPTSRRTKAGGAAKGQRDPDNSAARGRFRTAQALSRSGLANQDTDGTLQPAVGVAEGAHRFGGRSDARCAETAKPGRSDRAHRAAPCRGSGALGASAFEYIPGLEHGLLVAAHRDADIRVTCVTEHC